MRLNQLPVDSTPTPPSKPTTRTGLFHHIPLADLIVLLSFAVVYTALLTWLGSLRVENFLATNWDLGINQQLLWTGSHGRLLYETGDAEFFGVKSFLQIHLTLVAVLVAPLYAANPFPSTLFALQAGVFVASVFPLYLLAREVIRSRVLTFAVIGLYLASFPVLSALLYDFHWEAFMPLEFLSFFYLFRHHRYSWSLIPVAFGVFTLEVFPFLVGGAALLLLLEEAYSSRLSPGALLKRRNARTAILMIVAMGAVYVGVRLVQFEVIPPLVGASLTPGGLSGGIGGPFQVGATLSTLGRSTLYWLLLLAAFAFLPVLAPRYLVLSVPWFVYSFLLHPSFSSYFGDQYALVAVSTLSVALIYGAAHVENLDLRRRGNAIVIGALLASGVLLAIVGALWSREVLSGRQEGLLLAGMGVPPIVLVTATLLRRGQRGPTIGIHPESKRSIWRQPVTRATVLGATFAAFVALNVVVSPLNTANYGATPYPGYWLKYDPNPSAADLPWLTEKIPAGAVVLTSDFLFPYVANDPNAWAVTWYPIVPDQPPLYFPFSATNLPRFVLIDQGDWGNFPVSVSDQLLNTSTYGLVAYIASNVYPGPIYLFELGYSSTPQVRDATPIPPAFYFDSSNLSIGPSGSIDAKVPRGVEPQIESQAVSDPSGVRNCIWFGPYAFLWPGRYTVEANLSVTLAPGGNRSQPVLYMNGGPAIPRTVPLLYSFEVYASNDTSPEWEVLTWSIDVPAPYPAMEFRGYLDYQNGAPKGHVVLNYIELAMN